MVLFFWEFTPAVQSADVETHYLKYSSFKVPFNFPDQKQRGMIDSIVLYVSDDFGKSYRAAITARSTDTYFSFTAPRQGTYLFVPQARYRDGRVSTADPSHNAAGAQPALKIVVDTTAPQVTLRQMQPQGSDLFGIEWNILDENPDPRSLQVEYKPANGSSWNQLSVPLSLLGQTSWTPREGPGVYDVRLRVADLAKNQSEKSIRITPGNLPGGTQPSATTDPGRPLILNRRNLKLNYEDVETGKIEIAEIRVYAISQEEKRWTLLESFPAPPPADHKLPITVKGEGTWGFKITLKNSANKGEAPPSIGTQPDLWVTIDETKPVVNITETRLAGTVQNTQMTIAWTASDKNMAERPISIYYASTQTPTTWVAIAQGLPNDRQYLWNLPPEIPATILIKVEAVDQANNIGAAITSQPVITDLSTPRARIHAVEVGTSDNTTTPPPASNPGSDVPRVKGIEGENPPGGRPADPISPPLESPKINNTPGLGTNSNPSSSTPLNPGNPMNSGAPVPPSTPMNPFPSPSAPPSIDKGKTPGL